MKILVICKTCGAKIAKTAKACPSCGAKQHQGAYIAISIISAFIVIAIFGVIVAAIQGIETEPTLVDKTSSASGTSVSESKSEAETPSVFGVGDTANLNDIHVTFTSISQGNGKEYMRPEDGNVFILCEFEIENISDRDIAVSSLVSFNAYIDDYASSMSLTAIMAGDKGQLDGTIAAGKKMKGTIGYEADADWKEIEIHFTPEFWTGKDIKFSYKR